MKNNLKNQKGVILILTLFLLFGILVITLGAADLVVAGIKMNRLTGYSGLAFFASEAGMERALWEARKNGYALPAESTDNLFSLSDLGNGSSYQVDYASSTAGIVFQSIGSYGGAKRTVESSYLAGYAPDCVPNCSGFVCGSDGCGGSCGSCVSPQVCVSGACQAPPAQSCEFNFPVPFPWVFNCLF